MRSTARPWRSSGTLRDRKTNAGDVAKVGAGTAIGAVAGRVIGGSTKGAVIGGIIGGAVGTQRAIETQDRDVVVPANSRVDVTLGGHVHALAAGRLRSAS